MDRNLHSPSLHGRWFSVGSVNLVGSGNAVPNPTPKHSGMDRVTLPSGVFVFFRTLILFTCVDPSVAFARLQLSEQRLVQIFGRCSRGEGASRHFFFLSYLPVLFVFLGNLVIFNCVDPCAVSARLRLSELMKSLHASNVNFNVIFVQIQERNQTFTNLRNFATLFRKCRHL